jgi:ATP-dependent DNA helicase RecQ
MSAIPARPAGTPPDPPATVARQPRCVCIDIETPHTGEPVVHKLAAFRPDTGARVVVKGSFSAAELGGKLDELADGAAFVLGHNVRRHDLPVLAQLYPGLALHGLPVVDSLELSPLAFPENPYHRLVKDYKLVSDARNDPLRDAELSLTLFLDEQAAFRSLAESRPDDVALFHFFLTGDAPGGLRSMFEAIRRAPRPSAEEAASALGRSLSEKVCRTRLAALSGTDLRDAGLHSALAYVVAWLRVAGGNSVLPPWVHRTSEDVARLVHELREVPCDDPACGYCRQYHHPETLLASYFNKPSSFRPTPANAAGGSLQRDIVVAGLGGRSLMAVLPTGAGKSLCYQLPALAHYWRSGKLTVVVSPLQSLMKDQIDNLVRHGVYSAVALNGLLTPPERKEVLRKIELGEAGIVLVSPEQFRNRSFATALTGRQIGAWVFDEAHCLSKWGHDFRTDYLYVSRFIRERFPHSPARIACFTATAKPDVIADLCEHFKTELGVELTLFSGGHERTNLAYEVVPVTKAEKPARILEILERELTGESGGAIVFAATRRNAEILTEFIAGAGWSCAFFHAGMEPGTKREVQQQFVDDALRVIVATNAFGMGVDKPNVRVVLHADIPGSLESYLQEAGRAGRDGDAARCVLLYDEEDVETQFGLAARSRLTHGDFAAILRALRNRARKLKSDEIVVTASELLLGEDVHSTIDPEAADAETKVKTAVAHLERARFLVREENATRVFPASLKVQSLAEASSVLERADLSDEVRKRYLDVLALVMSAESAEGISTDELFVKAGVPAEESFRILHNLEKLGLLANDLGLRVVLRKGVKDASSVLLQRSGAIERELVELMAESAPDAPDGEGQVVTLRPLCEGVRQRLAAEVPPDALIPDTLLGLLRAMAQPFGEGGSKRAMLQLRKVGVDELRVRVTRPWDQIRSITRLRRAAAGVVLNALLGKLPASLQSADAIVECKAGELVEALRTDLELAPQLTDLAVALEQALLYLHETGVLILDKGRTVFRSAMTIRLLPQEGAGRFVKEDFAPLERHYAERNVQIHVMNEFARQGARRIADALALVAAYFSWTRERFVQMHFAGRRELLEFATTAESYRRIVEDLRHPVQARLVQARDTGNRLVLAGPGSGKTRVVVHRVAYLLRVLRVAPESIIVLAFNRAAAVEIRQRLRALVGADAWGVTVLTYHAMALRLTGASLGKLDEAGVEPDFDDLIRRAVDLLEGRSSAGGDPDELRDRLLRGYRFILVDEYQDIDANQYALVSALAGRTVREGEKKLSLMAVGDDDQNVYAFRKTSVEFIRRFREDYQAETVYLVENYRSTQHIITAANQVIAGAPGRMKTDHPIRIDHARAGQPAGGRWERLDEVARGQVQLFRVPADRNVQAQLAMKEIERLRALDPGVDWSRFAVIARTHATLEPVRAYCEKARIPYRTGERGAGLSAVKTREGHRVLAALRRRSGRLVRSGALARWVALLARREPENPWWEDLAVCTETLASATGGVPVPAADTVEWLYESAGAHLREARGHLNLCTAHGAKGREFGHVVVLDAGDWAGAEEERRLLYVAMTRAKETLTLFEASQRGLRFLGELRESEAVRAVEPKVVPLPLPALERIHRELTMRDVDLGFAGRRQEGDVVHKAIGRLRVGDSLELRGRDLLDGSQRVVGRLAKGFELPAGEVQSVRVAAIVRRSEKQTVPEFRDGLKVSEWETVLVSMVVRPASGSEGG